MAGWMRMAYRYDTSGNLVSNGWVTYQYSDRGRLASATFVNVTTHYSYNALGQRVAKSGFAVPTGAVRYVYDEAGHLLGEYGRAGDAFQETVYLGDTPVVTIRNGEPYYIYADQIDTPRVITDTNNLMVWRWDQADPFGAMPPNMNPSGLGVFVYNLRFPGQVYDQETGKHYNANRDYDPLSGRYIQSDPIGLNGAQWSTYNYVFGNPNSYSDATGLAPGDKWYGYNNKNFQDWAHAEKQEMGRAADENFTKDDIEELWKEWERQGQPKGKGGKSGKGGRYRAPRGYIDPALLRFCSRGAVGLALALYPSPLACSELPENCKKSEEKERQEREEP